MNKQDAVALERGEVALDYAVSRLAGSRQRDIDLSRTPPMQ